MIGLFSFILLVFGLSFFFLFVFSLCKPKNGLSAPFAIMCLSAAIYIIGYSFELRADTMEQVRFILKLEYFGAPFMSAFWIFFSYKVRTNKSVPLWLGILILVLPFMTLFFSVTNEYHQLIYKEINLFEYQGYMLTDLSKGPWYYVNTTYAYCAQLFGIIVFSKAWRDNHSVLKVQAKMMLIGSIWPGLMNVIYVLGLSPLELDLTPFGMGFSAVFFYLATFRYGFLNMREIVRNTTFYEISEGIIVIDDRNRLIDYNNAGSNIFKWLNNNNIGRNISDFQEGSYILSKDADKFEMHLENQGASRYFELRKTILKENAKNIGSVYFLQDISIQKEMMQRLNELANYDSLTNLYNRRKLMEEAEELLQVSRRYGKNLSLLMFDIDHFKKINDYYGHQAGDEVLRVLTGVCRKRLRGTDIMGRYGGEEFLIILRESDCDDAYRIAEEIRNMVENLKINFQQYEIKITISIGIKTTILGENYSIDDLIKCADTALYDAKNSGRNNTKSYDLP